MNSILTVVKETLESLGTDYEFNQEEDVLKITYLGTELEFSDLDDLDDLRNEILVRCKLEEIKNLVKEREEEVELEFDKDVWALRGDDESGWGILIKAPSWVDHARILVNPERLDQLEGQILGFLSLKYIEEEGCYREDYLEVVIKFEEWYLEYLKYEIVDPGNENDRLNYEVSPISDDFINVININEKYDDDSFFPDDLMTLKIRNINKTHNISVGDEKFLHIAYYVAKCVLFDIARKHSIYIDLNSANINPVVDPPEGMEEEYQEGITTSRCILTKDYDSDLIEYYYVANQMTVNEFKYLAFYRIIECIFDEVYLHETTQDIKQIVTSNWFTPTRNQDIWEIIKIVEQYNKNKNDREKLKLVLEKYFRGDNHEEAYFLANQDIISILQNDLRKIRSKDEIKDLQKLANILYDFRCNCAHSNRAFPAREVYEGTNSELENYIKLIRRVSERIIVNYGL